ncbi:MAG: hypothetical protein AAF211_32215, partial [Myxococcota bacterium]
GTGGAADLEKVEEAFAEGLIAAGGGLLVVDPRLSAVADAVALDEVVNAERSGVEVLRQRRYEGAAHVVVPDFKRFTLAHRVVPDARRWVRQLGIQQAMSEDGGGLYTISAANGITVGIGSARDGRQRDWVLIVGQGRFTMDDLARPLPDDQEWTIQVPDVDRVDVYWQPAADGSLGQASGSSEMKVTLPSDTDSVSVLATKGAKRFEIARMQLSDPDGKPWTEAAILEDLQALRESFDVPPLTRIDVLPCNAINLEDGTALSGDRTCWTFPAPADRSLWSELRAQPHLWADLARADRDYVSIRQSSDELELQFRSSFEPLPPARVQEAVAAHPRLSEAAWNDAGSKRLDRRLETMRGSRLAKDAARIRDEVLDASPLFTSMGTTTFAVGYGARLDRALDQATRSLDKMPSEVAVGYRVLRSDKLGYLHVVAVAAHRSRR